MKGEPTRRTDDATYTTSEEAKEPCLVFALFFLFFLSLLPF